MKYSDRQRNAANDRVSTWASLDSRTASIRPLKGGGAQVSLAGVDRHFDSVEQARDEVEAMGLTAHVERFGATPLVLAESPALRVV